jgi:hypothetical protein
MGSPLYQTNPTIPFGSQIVTINGVAYITESVSCKKPTTKVTREDQLGAPLGLVLVVGRYTFTGKLQLATKTTPAPSNGMTFSYTPQGDAAKTFVVEDVTQPTTNKTIPTVDITATQAA